MIVKGDLMGAFKLSEGMPTLYSFFSAKNILKKVLYPILSSANF